MSMVLALFGGVAWPIFLALAICTTVGTIQLGSFFRRRSGAGKISMGIALCILGFASKRFSDILVHGLTGANPNFYSGTAKALTGIGTVLSATALMAAVLFCKALVEWSYSTAVASLAQTTAVRIVAGRRLPAQVRAFSASLISLFGAFGFLLLFGIASQATWFSYESGVVGWMLAKFDYFPVVGCRNLSRDSSMLDIGLGRISIATLLPDGHYAFSTGRCED